MPRWIQSCRHACLVPLLLAPLCALPASGQTSGIQARIVNGVSTQGQPTTGALLFPVGSGFSLVCSGTLIGCQSFLTAAHCVCPGTSFCTPDPASFAVYLQHGGIFSVSAAAVAPGYQFGVAEDVAVLTLASPATGVPPTPINTQASPAPGTRGIIAGFGITGGSKDDAGLLRQGQVTTAS